MFELVKDEQFRAKIRVIGIGGCGNNAVNAMIRQKIRGVEFIAMNTDMDVLKSSLASINVQLGEKLTQGLGAGGDPEIGRQATIESIESVRNLIEGSHMVFITAGMGGGTGTGGAPVVAELAKEMGILTIGVVTKPFIGEGKFRCEIGKSGIEELKRSVDALIVIDNNKLLSSMAKSQLAKEAFHLSNEPLVQAVRGISEVITIKGFINVDFADVRAVMKETGVAVMGSAEASGEERALTAVQNAISNSLVEFSGISGAKGVLVNVTGDDITIQEYNEILNLIQEEADDDARIISGLVFDEEMNDKVRVTIVATGFGRRRGSYAERTQSRIKSEKIDFNDLETPAFLRRSSLFKKVNKPSRVESSSTVDPLKIADDVFMKEKDDNELF